MINISMKARRAPLLKSVAKTPRRRMMIFIVVFAAIGSFLLLRSFAASPPIATVQTEKMSLPLGASIITDAAASGGKAVKLTRNGLSQTGQVTLPNTATSLSLMAKGQKCNGGWPRVTLQIDGKTVMLVTNVSSNSWRSYPVSVSLPAGTHNITILPTIEKSCGRDLYTDSLTFYGAPSPTPTVTLNASPTSVAFNNASTLTWSTTNATGCTASGSWSGAKATSGSASTGALAASAAYTLTCTGAGGTAATTAAVTVTGNPYTFNDEFDGPSGAVPSAKWRNDVGSWQPNGEREYYTAAGVNDYLDGAGHLVIQPTVDNGAHTCWYGPCSFASSRITTLGTFSQAYGTWSARIKLNPQQGLWPAFWFLGDNINTVGWPASGEIDAMENFGYNAWGAALHGSVEGYDVNFGGGYAGFNTSPTDWHEYGVKVTPDSISFLFDSAIYATQSKAAFIAQYGANSWPFDKPFFPILNVAVGGSGTNNVLPTPPLSPMLVDYVRFTAQ